MCIYVHAYSNVKVIQMFKIEDKRSIYFNMPYGLYFASHSFQINIFTEIQLIMLIASLKNKYSETECERVKKFSYIIFLNI